MPRDGIDLPANFRWQDARAFHARQAQGVTIRSGDGPWQAALDLDGVAAVATFTPVPAGGSLVLAWAADEPLTPARRALGRRRVCQLLGLGLDPGPWERHARTSAWWSALVAARPGLRVPGLPDLGSALVWAVLGQQVSRTAASRILARLLVACPGPAGAGLRPFPAISALAACSDATLTAAGLSRQKVRTLRVLATVESAGDLHALAACPTAEAEARLCLLPGIGPWTARYALMRGLAAADCLPVGDAVIHAEVGRRLALPGRPTARQVELVCAPAAPWRSLAAAHLWAAADAAGDGS